MRFQRLVLVWTVATLSAGATAIPTAATQRAAGAPRSVWDGVYTAAQADRAAGLYREQCASCHAQTMRGAPGSPPLAGPEFRFAWNGRTVGELVDVIRKTMPPGGAGRLSDQQYADLVAAIFQANNFPAGATELPAARSALEAIVVTRSRPAAR